MPLDQNGSKESIGPNVKREEEAGRPHKQAVAIALNVARESGGRGPAASRLAPAASDLLQGRYRQPRKTRPKVRTMNAFRETDLANQQARAWSAHLGALAVASRASPPGAALTQLNTLPSGLPPRVSAILNHLRQRRQRQEQAADKLRAQEFMMGP